MSKPPDGAPIARPGAPREGRRFRNAEPTPRGGTAFAAFWKWQRTRAPGPWRPWTPLVAGLHPPPPRVDDGAALRVTFVNHSTVLLQTAGLNILTDPVWSKRTSPFQWFGPARRRPPGVAFTDLPPIDLVLLSHDHYDHLDLPTLKRLAARDAPAIVCGLGVGRFLAARGVPGARELDWWQSTDDTPGGLRVTAVPAQHFAGRAPGDLDTRLWVGLVVEAPGGPLYFAGDTGWGAHFAAIREVFGPLRLALLPIGAYKPAWFMSAVHIGPEEAVRAHQLLGARTSLGIHFGTFQLADDGQDEPLEDLDRALAAAGLTRDAFWVLEHGEGRLAPALQGHIS